MIGAMAKRQRVCSLTFRLLLAKVRALTDSQTHNSLLHQIQELSAHCSITTPLLSARNNTTRNYLPVTRHIYTTLADISLQVQHISVGLLQKLSWH